MINNTCTFRKIVFAVCAGSLLLFAHYSYADAVEVMRLYGNTVIPVKESNVRMLKEVVHITAAPDMDNSVDTVFTFQNTTERNIKLKMGFPFKKIYSDAVGGIYREGCNSFITIINGKQINVIKSKVNKLIKSTIGSQYDYMFTWEVLFKPKEKKTIECKYSCLRSLTDSEWKKGLSDIQVHYITKTGGFWKGTIGEAVFYAKINPDIIKAIKKAPHEHPKYVYMPYHIRGLPPGRFKIGIDIKPTNYTIEGDWIKWSFKNWKPTQDIMISIYDIGAEANR